MSQFITLNQLMDFYNKKALEEESNPKKAQAEQSKIKDVMNKYIKKGMIHGRDDAIAPTEDQWKIIKTYYKDKINRWKTKITKNVIEKTMNKRKIQSYEDEMKLALKMYRWAKDFRVTQETKELSSILVLKSSEKEVIFEEPSKSITPKEENATKVYIVKDKLQQNTSKKQHDHYTRYASKLEGDESDDEEEDKNTQPRRKKTSQGTKRDRQDEQQSLSDVPPIDRSLSYVTSNHSDSEKELKEFEKTPSLPPQYEGKAIPTTLMPPTYPMLTPNMLWTSPGITQQPLLLLNTPTTHKINGGEISLTPMEPPNKDMERKMEEFSQRLTALTSIMQDNEKLRQYDERQMEKLRQEMFKQRSQDQSDGSQTTGQRTPQPQAETYKEKANTTVSSPEEEIEVYGKFTGTIDETEYENAPIDGIVEQEQRMEAARNYPIRMSGQQLVYMPFTVKDWGEVMLALPNLAKGGVAWLRALLKKTAGDKLGWGDIQAALIKSADETVATNIKKALEGRLRIVRISKTMDIAEFRDHLEEELRKRFPCIVTDEFLSMQMKSDEDYYSYKQRATTLYHDVTGEPINARTGMSVVFRTTLVRGMPRSVQDSLQDVMGLYTKPEDEFDAHCNHHVAKWLRTKKDQEEKKQELELATVKLQLQKYQDEFKDKKKSTKVMNVQPDSIEAEETIVNPIINQVTTAINTLMQNQQQQRAIVTPNVQQGPPMTTPSGVKYKQSRRVLKHYSYKLDPHEQSQPGCARYLAALTKTIEKTSHVVQNHPLVVHTQHGILAYLNSRLFITTAQRSSNISKTLRQPHITYEKGDINMATNMETEGTPHVCEEIVKTELYIRVDLQTTPLQDPEMTVFCDGCSYRAKEGHIISSYAVVEQLSPDQHRVLEAKQITTGSAQQAELTAMLRALQLTEGKAVNIYTDSAYAYKTVTISLAGWIRNGFKLITGLPIKHEELIKQLIDAVKLPSRLAIMKCKAHEKTTDPVSLGNTQQTKLQRKLRTMTQETCSFELMKKMIMHLKKIK
ncbi:hypothetical protein WMY93_030325 [Mugilogobius chulae]|uniref:RNase H type-1 domain-containing protein n=1 Tax=Mugilogobius chulae TaxID=88201 RepID=A0AAW0MH77_9GOBI